jgi:hypothetical protein
LEPRLIVAVLHGFGDQARPAVMRALARAMRCYPEPFVRVAAGRAFTALVMADRTPASTPVLNEPATVPN